MHPAARTTVMRFLVPALAAVAILVPHAACAYDPGPDQNTIRVLRERIDGDVNQGVLPTDRAALMRAEIETAQTFVTNGDSQATAMLADIDSDLAPYDDTVDASNANQDLLYHIGDTITIAMRDGVAWQVGPSQNADVMDLKSKDAIEPPGVQGAYLAKGTGYTSITLLDPATAKKLVFRFYIVDKAAR